ncbi:MAG: hypothetical protein CMK29_05645 [Porticoccaceae bacterium]|nr:hypothetical protein [Porticoccaceae bacterium]OUW58359.1 MAG: hypothetical protein CBD57_02265 [Candidatus Pelagibacter sp. TMED197]|tara:strand:+ start:6902 stop:7117 length:216 start_codon:yes stop_codon:yes gene_type:complete
MAQMDDIEQLSYEESKRQTKERKDKGKNMIRPFTFDEEKILRDGLYNNNIEEKNEKTPSELLQEELEPIDG